MSRTPSPCQPLRNRTKTRVAVALIAGATAAILASPAGAHHRDRPHAPEHVRVADAGIHTILVSWSRSPSARVYRLYRNGAAVRRQRAPLFHRFGSLACDRTYRFAVRAYDRAGRRSRPHPVRARTAPCPPRNTELPSILGAAQETETLTASPGSWVGVGPLTFGYQWVRCASFGGACSPIPGATGSTYVVAAPDSSRSLRVQVRAENPSGSRTASSLPVGPVGGADPPPDPDPDPDGDCTIADTSGCVPGTTLRLTDAKFLCDRPLSSYGPLPLKVDVNFTPGRLFGESGAVDLHTGCAGDGDPSTIDLIVDVEGDGVTYGPGVDAFKVRQGAGYAAGIQLTGHVDCGPKYTPFGHQDGVQLQGGRDISFVDFSVGEYASGRSTCQGAGGAFFYSGASGYVPTNIDVVRGSYIACNHSLFVDAGTSGDIVGSRFRSGRNDGSDPLCDAYHASPACTGEDGQIDPDVTLASVSCQHWNPTTGRWE